MMQDYEMAAGLAVVERAARLSGLDLKARDYCRNPNMGTQRMLGEVGAILLNRYEGVLEDAANSLVEGIKSGRLRPVGAYWMPTKVQHEDNNSSLDQFA